jgi:hypothetical protein
MGAIGSAMIGAEAAKKAGRTNFKGFDIADRNFVSSSFECKGCPNRCEVVNIKDEAAVVGCFGDRCGKWSEKMVV